MKKAFHNTKVSVKLRKAEAREEWYLYIESYPVVVPGKDKPLRVREYVNRVSLVLGSYLKKVMDTGFLRSLIISQVQKENI